MTLRFSAVRCQFFPARMGTGMRSKRLGAAKRRPIDFRRCVESVSAKRLFLLWWVVRCGGAFNLGDVRYVIIRRFYMGNRFVCARLAAES